MPIMRGQDKSKKQTFIYRGWRDCLAIAILRPTELTDVVWL